jgi:cyclophilin family peptidyl-prolyl cis-trans isomerase
MSSKANYKVYMDVQIGATGAGRIIFELFNDLTPKTAENFRGLCTGEYGKVNNNKLHYLNTKFHRIIDGFVIQGGDISNAGGKGGFSIYGRTFVD